jgi:hypothetical protein
MVVGQLAHVKVLSINPFLEKERPDPIAGCLLMHQPANALLLMFKDFEVISKSFGPNKGRTAEELFFRLLFCLIAKINTVI